jgi:hypothetical protein
VIWKIEDITNELMAKLRTFPVRQMRLLTSYVKTQEGKDKLNKLKNLINISEKALVGLEIDRYSYLLQMEQY